MLLLITLWCYIITSLLWWYNITTLMWCYFCDVILISNIFVMLFWFFFCDDTVVMISSILPLGRCWAVFFNLGFAEHIVCPISCRATYVKYHFKRLSSANFLKIFRTKLRFSGQKLNSRLKGFGFESRFIQF